MGRLSAPARAWLRSGLAELTGRPDGPALLAPAQVVERMQQLGSQAGADALGLAVERATALGLTRRGSTSADGATRLLPAADGWVAVALIRAEDLHAVPSWLDLPAGTFDEADPWAAVAPAVATRTCAALVDRATTLQLPVSGVGDHERAGAGPAVATQVGGAAAFRRAPLVLELATCWAGPLCGRILADAGARVIKVEPSTRADGDHAVHAGHAGHADFLEAMDSQKEVRLLDLGDEEGLAALRDLLARAEVVVASSPPDVLRPLDVDAVAALRAEVGPQVWVSITGHGRDVDRVALGDDGAAAGGLVAWDEHGPCFVADAIGDPLAGLAAAGVVRTALQAGGRWLVDVSTAGAAAHVAGEGGPRWSPAP